jgi:putative ABC transport system permease protein
MRLTDLLRVSIRQVLRHRRRYLGVVLAIALGTAGVITIITMGRQFKYNINQDLDLLGKVTVIRFRFDNEKASRLQWFRPEAAAAVSRLPGVQSLSLLAAHKTAAVWRDRRQTLTVFGVDEFFWEVNNYHPLTGALIGPEAVAGRQRVCVVGADQAKKLFGRQDIVGLFLEIHHDLYRIIGVLEESVPESLSQAVFLPLTTAQDRLPGGALPASLFVRCHTWDDVPFLAATVPKVVQDHQEAEYLRAEVRWWVYDRTVRIAWWVEFFVHMAVGVTLILGGVGVWNIMMAAVRSRTREIGLKKAMGAEDYDIMAQFLTEALCLSLGAALLGVAAGRLAVVIVGQAMGTPPPERLFLFSVGLSLLFAVIIGMAAGLYPSVQASRMDVVEATRYE